MGDWVCEDGAPGHVHARWHSGLSFGVLEAFRCSVTRRSFRNLVLVVTGWLLTPGMHAVTAARVAARIAGKRHHAAFHRFFSRTSRSADSLGFALFGRLERWLEPGTVSVAIVDTLAPHKGPKVFGLGSHLDPVRSTKAFRVFCFGHCWVVRSLLVRVPFSERTWAVPILFRLYRNLKECEKAGAAYRKKTQLARKMVDVLCGWTADRIEVAADCAYCNDTVTRGLPKRVVLFGSMRPDAVLTALPDPSDATQNGRPRKFPRSVRGTATRRGRPLKTFSAPLSVFLPALTFLIRPVISITCISSRDLQEDAALRHRPNGRLTAKGESESGTSGEQKARKSG